MKTDLKFILYSLKSIFEADFKSKELMLLLNDLDPETYLEEYVKSLKLNPVNENKVRLRLRHILETAKNERIPLGIETEPYGKAEDAYLARQRYISTVVQKEQFIASVNKSVILLFLTALTLLIIFIANI